MPNSVDEGVKFVIPNMFVLMMESDWSEVIPRVVSVGLL